MKHHEFSQSYYEANGYTNGDTDIPWLCSDFWIAFTSIVGIILCIAIA